MLRIALIGATPQLRGELDAGLAQLGGFEVVLHAATLGDAQAKHFGGAEVAIVDVTAADAADTAETGAGPPLVLLAGAGDDLGGWWREGASLLPRSAPIAQVAAAAVAAAAGLVCTTPAMSARFAPASDRPAAPPYEALTPRELEVLRQMSFGLANREIADALHISPHTAKFHVAQVIAKLNAGSRAHAVANALRAGLVDEAA